jgi:hypothetical protein
MEEPLKTLIQNLGDAINDSLGESDQIAEAIGEIKKAGYDVFLILQATIGFSKREDPVAELMEKANEYDKSHAGKPLPEKFTSKDMRFLSALKIKDPDQ